MRLDKIERDLELRKTTQDAAHYNAVKRWDAAPNTACLRLNVHDKHLCSIEAVRDAIHPWLYSVGLALDDTAFPSGGPNPLSTSFSLVMAGQPVEGEQRARKATQILKKTDGTWDRLYVSLPNGDRVQLYISPDKSDKMMFSDMCGKKLVATLKDMYPDKQFHLLRKDATITIGWERAVRIEVKEDRTSWLTWINEVINRNEINKEEVVCRFDRACQAANANLQWSL